jgi:hypothetical protein
VFSNYYTFQRNILTRRIVERGTVFKRRSHTIHMSTNNMTLSTNTHHNFALRLHKLLKDSSGSACGWMNNGSVFAIFDVAHFASEVLPVHFGTTTLNKFAQLLSLHGFKRTMVQRSTTESSSETESYSGDDNVAPAPPTTKSMYTFSRDLFTRDASPLTLTKIRRQSNRRASCLLL